MVLFFVVFFFPCLLLLVVGCCVCLLVFNNYRFTRCYFQNTVMEAKKKISIEPQPDNFNYSKCYLSCNIKATCRTASKGNSYSISTIQ